MRGATTGWTYQHPNGMVSIHAPHAGRDYNHDKEAIKMYGFNPRAPCGARHK